MVMTWKIFHGESVIKPEDILKLSRTSTRGHSMKIFIERSNTDARKRFFTSRVAPEWNSLPVEVVEANTLERYKFLLLEHRRERHFEYFD